MDNRQKIKPGTFVAVFAITTLVFVAGILLGNFFAGKKLQQIDQLGQELKTDTAAIEIQYDILADDPCKSVNTTPLAEDLYILAEKLDYMENSLGEDNTDVRDLKRYYSILELRNWLFLKKTNRLCDDKKTLILYFYGTKDSCPKCEEQGFILTWVRKNYPHVYIYSFDYGLDNAALKAVKEIYGVKSTPAVVIGDKVFNRFMTKDEIMDVVGQVEEAANGGEGIAAEEEIGSSEPVSVSGQGDKGFVAQ
jgi:glutaredoxin